MLFSLSIYSEKAKVERVVDGDTLLLEDGRKVRLIGVDTPEVHESKKLYKDAKRNEQDIKTIKELGKRASLFTKNMVNGLEIELEYDNVNKRNGHRDRYGRILAYVSFYCEEFPPEYIKFLKKTKQFKIIGKNHNLMLNKLIIQCGYANAYTKFPFQYMDDFREQEKLARTFEIGLWGPIKGLKQIDETSKPIAKIQIKK